eukprot:Tamp_03009.p1 GENE.Tamp_03009~~Tamp_03009.p1  ORF type:complete len:395 (-),score=104.07 Tamp_03009:682-1866(-)
MMLSRAWLAALAAVALLAASGTAAPVPDDADLADEIAFFKLHDTNGDGFHSKKEFYYAIMEDDFEALASKYDKAAVDMEFELADANSDKKISIEEWKGVFFHEEPQEPTYIDGKLQEGAEPPQEEAPPAPAPPTSTFSGLATGKPKGEMHIGTELTLADARKVYLSEDATWYETRDFCHEKGVRLCNERELCPREGNQVGQDPAFSDEDREKRWVPLLSRGHLWLELRNCGLTRWPDQHQHPGVIICCEDEAQKPPPSAPSTAASDSDSVPVGQGTAAKGSEAAPAVEKSADAAADAAAAGEKVAAAGNAGTAGKADADKVKEAAKTEDNAEKKTQGTAEGSQKPPKPDTAAKVEELKVEPVEKVGKKGGKKKGGKSGKGKGSKTKGIKPPKVG